MNHVKGINWQIVHELLTAEIDRINAGTSTYAPAGGNQAAKQWILDELNRMNGIAVENAEKQS
jgi:hypothetical protein